MDIIETLSVRINGGLPSIDQCSNHQAPKIKIGFLHHIDVGCQYRISKLTICQTAPRFPLMFIEAFEHVLSDGSIPFLMPVENQGSTVAAIDDF